MLDISEVLDWLDYNLVVAAPNDRSAAFRVLAVKEWAAVQGRILSSPPAFN